MRNDLCNCAAQMPVDDQRLERRLVSQMQIRMIDTGSMKHFRSEELSQRARTHASVCCYSSWSGLKRTSEAF
ncbi:hypothetical protein QQF64_010570 [Cirrhinus molitorella]|uniref:Uncharacterized protein n=1 Tax=Cirrhinus molitorella TaxID=172907 RepID=A0ABR3LZ84_9TELE